MWLFDQWVECYIIEVQCKGEFDNLSGCGELFILDDDFYVLVEFCVGYCLFKNVGCFFFELEQCRDVIQLFDIFNSIWEDDF